MSTSIAQPALGLAPDQHPGLAPKGAMSQADNVVGDLPGVLRGRPNTFVAYSEDALDPDDYARIDTLIRVGDEWLAHQGAATSDKAWRNATGVLTGIDGGSPDPEVACSSAEARGSTYIGTTNGVAKLVAAGSQELVAAGVEMGIAQVLDGVTVPRFATSFAGPFSGDYAVGYRLVIKRTDANGYTARSAPSRTFVVENTGATDESVLLWGNASDERYLFGDGVCREGDIIEFYRTRTVASSTGPLGPDYYLVATYEITATDVSNGYFPSSATDTFDTLEDTQLGEALYTNPGRGGALASKYPPPRSQCLALWAGVMWYGNVLERVRAPYQFKTVGGGVEVPSSATASDGQSLGVNTRSGTWVSGVAQITGVADVTGIRVGQAVFTSSTIGPQGSADFPAETLVASISGAGPYTLGLTAAPTTSDTDTFYTGDVVEVDGVAFYAKRGAVPSAAQDRTFKVSTLTDADERAAETAASFALTVNAYMAENDGGVRVVGALSLVAVALGAQVGQLVFEATSPDGQFTVGPSSAPVAFSPTMAIFL